mgnify:CR=1 FL=1
MKTITSIVFIISFSILSFSQGNRDKIKTLKIAFITEKLDLSEKEAQQFWPVYNTFEEENYKLRKQSFEGRKNINFETLKEEDALVLLKEMRSFESKRLNLKNNYIDDLSKMYNYPKDLYVDAMLSMFLQLGPIKKHIRFKSSMFFNFCFTMFYLLKLKQVKELLHKIPK